MVCDRCVKVVKDILENLGIDGAAVGLGYINIPCDLTAEKLCDLDDALTGEGFEIVKTKDEGIVQQIKSLLIGLARSGNGTPMKLSVYLSEKLKTDYAALSRLFSGIEGRTIERYYIVQKIEFVKELIDYGGTTLSEIACRTGYSSVAHLSRQFKEVTGLTPSAYKESGLGHRPLDKI